MTVWVHVFSREDHSRPVEIGQCRDDQHGRAWFNAKYGADEYMMVFYDKPTKKGQAAMTQATPAFFTVNERNS